MEIKMLAQQIERLINEKMEIFSTNGKKSSEISRKIIKLQEDQAILQRNMYEVLKELEPVESIVRMQNPNLNDLFDKLKKAYHVEAEQSEEKSVDEIIKEIEQEGM